MFQTSKFVHELNWLPQFRKYRVEYQESIKAEMQQSRPSEESENVAGDHDVAFLRNSGAALLINSLVEHLLKVRPVDPSAWLQACFESRQFGLTPAKFTQLLQTPNVPPALLLQCLADVSPRDGYTPGYCEAVSQYDELLYPAAEALLRAYGDSVSTIDWQPLPCFASVVVQIAQARSALTRRSQTVSPSFTLHVVMPVADVTPTLKEQIVDFITAMRWLLADLPLAVLKTLFVACDRGSLPPDRAALITRSVEKVIHELGMGEFCAVVHSTESAGGYALALCRMFQSAKSRVDDGAPSVSIVFSAPLGASPFHYGAVGSMVSQVLHPPDATEAGSQPSPSPHPAPPPPNPSNEKGKKSAPPPASPVSSSVEQPKLSPGTTVCVVGVRDHIDPALHSTSEKLFELAWHKVFSLADTPASVDVAWTPVCAVRLGLCEMQLEGAASDPSASVAVCIHPTRAQCPGMLTLLCELLGQKVHGIVARHTLSCVDPPLPQIQPFASSVMRAVTAEAPVSAYVQGARMCAQARKTLVQTQLKQGADDRHSDVVTRALCDLDDDKWLKMQKGPAGLKVSSLTMQRGHAADFVSKLMAIPELGI